MDGLKLLVRFLPFLVIALIIYSVIKNKSHSKLKSSKGNKSKHLGSGIYIEKNYRGEYNLIDKDGFGLVYGKVKKMAFENKPPQNLFVEYQHAKKSEELFALIDLETLEVKTIQEEEVPVQLNEIDSYF